MKLGRIRTQSQPLVDGRPVLTRALRLVNFLVD